MAPWWLQARQVPFRCVFSKKDSRGQRSQISSGEHRCRGCPGARLVSPVASQVPAVVLAASSAMASAHVTATACCPRCLLGSLLSALGLPRGCAHHKFTEPVRVLRRPLRGMVRSGSGPGAPRAQGSPATGRPLPQLTPASSRDSKDRHSNERSEGKHLELGLRISRAGLLA